MLLSYKTQTQYKVVGYSFLNKAEQINAKLINANAL